jgi:hypothetical protein
MFWLCMRCMHVVGCLGVSIIDSSDSTPPNDIIKHVYVISRRSRNLFFARWHASCNKPNYNQVSRFHSNPNHDYPTHFKALFLSGDPFDPREREGGLKCQHTCQHEEDHAKCQSFASFTESRVDSPRPHPQATQSSFMSGPTTGPNRFRFPGDKSNRTCRTCDGRSTPPRPPPRSQPSPTHHHHHLVALPSWVVSSRPRKCRGKLGSYWLPRRATHASLDSCRGRVV